jgi:hypothetical protein
MRRRRFFRIATLTLLLLCLAAWGWSYLFHSAVTHIGANTFWVGIANGQINCVMIRDVVGEPGWDGYYSKAGLLFPPLIETVPPTDPNAHRFLGFYAENWELKSALLIPLWFPTLLLAAITAWAWRKRRSEGERGFAVEGADQLREVSGEKRE